MYIPSRAPRLTPCSSRPGWFQRLLYEPRPKIATSSCGMHPHQLEYCYGIWCRQFTHPQGDKLCASDVCDATMSITGALEHSSSSTNAHVAREANLRHDALTGNCPAIPSEQFLILKSKLFCRGIHCDGFIPGVLRHTSSKRNIIRSSYAALPHLFSRAHKWVHGIR